MHPPPKIEAAPVVEFQEPLLPLVEMPLDAADISVSDAEQESLPLPTLPPAPVTSRRPSTVRAQIFNLVHSVTIIPGVSRTRHYSTNHDYYRRTASWTRRACDRASSKGWNHFSSRNSNLQSAIGWRYCQENWISPVWTESCSDFPAISKQTLTECQWETNWWDWSQVPFDHAIIQKPFHNQTDHQPQDRHKSWRMWILRASSCPSQPESNYSLKNFWCADIWNNYRDLQILQPLRKGSETDDFSNLQPVNIEGRRRSPIRTHRPHVVSLDELEEWHLSVPVCLNWVSSGFPIQFSNFLW